MPLRNLRKLTTRCTLNLCNVWCSQRERRAMLVELSKPNWQDFNTLNLLEYLLSWTTIFQWRYWGKNTDRTITGNIVYHLSLNTGSALAIFRKVGKMPCLNARFIISASGLQMTSTTSFRWRAKISIPGLVSSRGTSPGIGDLLYYLVISLSNLIKLLILLQFFLQISNIYLVFMFVNSLHC